MCGEDTKQEGMVSYISAVKRVPAEHPLRAIRKLVDAVLEEMSARFARLYAKVGRPSIAPERLLCAPNGTLAAARTQIWAKDNASREKAEIKNLTCSIETR